MIFDPVGTGISGNLTFAPNVHNVTVVRAENEYRNLFKAVNYVGEDGVTTLTMPGNHCDIGGGYDCGIGSLTLQAANSFFKKSGIAMNDVPTSRTFAPNADVYIHDEGFDGVGDARYRAWDTYSSVETDIGSVRLTSSLTTSESVAIDPNNSLITISEYTDVYGNVVHYARQTDGSGNFQEGTMKITDKDGHYVQRVYNNFYHEIEHEWTDSDGFHWEFKNGDHSYGSGYDLIDTSSHTETFDPSGNKYNYTRTADGIKTTITSHADGSSVKYVKYPNGTRENYSYGADGTDVSSIDNADGSYRHETRKSSGDYDLDWRDVDGSGEQIANHGISKYHAKYNSKGGVSAVFSDANMHGSSANDGRGSTTFDVWSNDGSEQHNWTKSDGSSSHETLNANGSRDISRTGGDGSSFELHTRPDGYSDQTTVAANGTITSILIHPDSSRQEQVKGVELDTFYHEHWKIYDTGGNLTRQSDEYKDAIGDNHETIVDYNPYDPGSSDTRIITVHPDKTGEEKETFFGSGGSDIKLFTYTDYTHNVYTMSGTCSLTDGTSGQYTGWGDHDIFSFITSYIHPDGGTEIMEHNNINGYDYFSDKAQVMNPDHTLNMIVQNVTVVYADKHGYNEIVTFIGNDVTHNLTHF